MFRAAEELDRFVTRMEIDALAIGHPFRQCIRSATVKDGDDALGEDPRSTPLSSHLFAAQAGRTDKEPEFLRSV